MKAGKSAFLRALQADQRALQHWTALTASPRLSAGASYNDITTKRAKPEEIDVVVAHFELEDEDKNAIEKEFSVRNLRVWGDASTTRRGKDVVGVPEKRHHRGVEQGFCCVSPPMWIVGGQRGNGEGSAQQRSRKHPGKI